MRQPRHLLGHRALTAALAVAVLGGCSGQATRVDTAPPSSPPTPAASPTAVASPTPAGSPSPVPPVTPSPAVTQPVDPSPEATLPPGPPAALLTLAGRTITGDLGTFTWSAGGTDFGTDAPWLPGEDAGPVPADTTMAVRFEPGLRIAEWTIRAAPAGREGDDTTVLASGSGAPIEARLSLAEGVWELQLSLELGSARDARGTGQPTYYWRVTIAP